jgi:hypothetical protein
MSKYNLEYVKQTMQKDNNLLLSIEYKNGKTLLDVKCGSCDKKYKIRFLSYLSGTRCNNCANIKKGISKRKSETDIKVVMEQRNHKLTKLYYRNKRANVEFTCNLCNQQFDRIFSNYMHSKYCCEHINDTTYEYVKNMVESNNEVLVSYRDIKMKISKMVITCNKCNENYTTSLKYYNKNIRCNLCNKYNKKTVDDVKKLISDGGDTLLSTKHKSCMSKINVLCHECDEVFKTTYNCYKSGNRCPKCSLKRMAMNASHTQEYVEEFIKSCGDTLDDKYINMSEKINIICGACNEQFSTRFSSYKSSGVRCPCKNRSKGERLIREFLNKSHIRYTEQKTFKGCKNKLLLRFDFYLKDYKLLIEFDGTVHFKRCDVMGGEKAMISQKINDDIKNKFCTKNKRYLLRIPYTKMKHIETIINNYISQPIHEYVEFSNDEIYNDMKQRLKN